MSKLSLPILKKLPPTEINQVLEKIRKNLGENKIIQEIFQEYQVPLEELYLIPMTFSDLDVSARTAHGIIYFNWKLLEDGQLENIDHYGAHEITHYLQQTTGTKPTQGSAEDDYLDNEFEIEGFQNQTKYLTNTRGKQEAEKYVQKVMDHHNVPSSERSEKKKELLNQANSNKQLNFNFKKDQEPVDRTELLQQIKDFVDNFEIRIEEIPINPKYIKQEKLPYFEQSFRMRKLKELLDSLPPNKE